MSAPANPYRGEASLTVRGQARLLRPSFAALVAAEEELGPLFALVERAAGGQLRLTEMTALFWHCLSEREGVSRVDVGEAIGALGLAGAAQPLRAVLAQVLQGSG